MRKGMCAPWCGRPATLYGIICAEHWFTLDQYDRERIRASWRVTAGWPAYYAAVAVEVREMRRRNRALSGH